MTTRLTALALTAAALLALAWGVSTWLDHALAVSIGSTR